MQLFNFSYYGRKSNVTKFIIISKLLNIIIITNQINLFMHNKYLKTLL